MDWLNKILDFNYASLLPDMDMLLGILRVGMLGAVLVGPVALLIFGLLYLLRPAKEANYSFGFRTYFGMGSQEAWRFSQKIAGMLFTAIGGMMLLAMVIVVILFAEQDPFSVASTAFYCLFWQLISVLLAWLTTAVLAAIYFDADGGRRWVYRPIPEENPKEKSNEEGPVVVPELDGQEYIRFVFEEE